MTKRDTNDVDIDIIMHGRNSRLVLDTKLVGKICLVEVVVADKKFAIIFHDS